MIQRSEGKAPGNHTTAPHTMAYYRPTIKQIQTELEALGGWLEVIRDTEKPEYAPHLSREERGWPHGLWVKDELIAWAKNTNLI